MILKTKKGDLQNNVISIIIVAIGLSLLFFGFFKLYQIGIDNESKNSQKTIETLIEKINNLEVNESNKFLIQGFNGVDNWFLIGWSNKDLNKPEKCFFNSCICVCKYSSGTEILRESYRIWAGAGSLKKYPDFIDENLKGVCQDNGFCRPIEKDELEVKSITPLYYEVGARDGFFDYPFISLESTSEINVSKKDKYLEITGIQSKKDIVKGNSNIN